jgi:hypothetical protein
MMRLKLIMLVPYFALFLIQLPAKEPLRAGIDVPEPRLIQRVDIPYPDILHNSFLGAGPVVLDILIDEQGLISDLTERSYSSSVLESTKAAIKGWRFSPTLIDGKAVQVKATVAVAFSLTSTPIAIDLGAKSEHLIIPPGNQCSFPATLDRDGNIKEMPDNRLVKYLSELKDGFWIKPAPEDAKWKSVKEDCGSQAGKNFRLTPEPDAPFSSIEKIMKEWAPPIHYSLETPRYRFPDGSGNIKYIQPGYKQLYYTTFLVSNGSQLVQLAGIDPLLQAPQFDADFARLSESLKGSRYPRGAIYFFTVFVDKNGSTLGVESRDENTNAATKALSEARVITPGKLNSESIPTAVVIAIPVN